MYSREDLKLTVVKGWWPLVEPIYNRIQELNRQGAEIVIIDIKEKWGELSISVNSAPKEIWDMIEEAEEKSAHVCENCGKPGETTMCCGGCVRTLCQECILKMR